MMAYKTLRKAPLTRQLSHTVRFHTYCYNCAVHDCANIGWVSRDKVAWWHCDTSGCLYVCTQVTKSQKDTGSNHAISALKFGIIKKFLQLGWAVLLSDIDVCVLQDPFKFLYR